MEEMMMAFEVGDYAKAHEVLSRLPEARTMPGVASSAFLLALCERFDEADALLHGKNMPAIALLVAGERQRLARARDPRESGSLAVSVPTAAMPIYAAMGSALASRDATLATETKRDAARVPAVAGTLHQGSRSVPFRDLVDSDDAIGQMLETYCGKGLLYFPFSTLRRIEVLSPTNFMDIVMRKVRIIDRAGTEAFAYVPLLYAGSTTSDDDTIRAGRMTRWEYVGEARRGIGQRDFVLDGGKMIGMQSVTAIEFN